VALIFAALLGLINGVIRIVTGIPSFIVTQGTLLAYRAIPLVIIPDGRIIRYADYRIPEPVITLNPWVLLAALMVLGLLILYIGIRTAPRLFGRLQAKLANYREDMSDFRDVVIVWLALRLLFTVVATVILIVLIGTAVVDLAGQTGTLLEVSFFNLANGRISASIRRCSTGINLRVGIFWWFLLVIVFQFILMNTYGTYLCRWGNPGARAQGISANRIKVTNFMLCGACGVAGIIYVLVGSVNADLGEGTELEVITAAVTVRCSKAAMAVSLAHSSACSFSEFCKQGWC
jgi:ribose/xylose/arabinose/galactoside ABC-type transport system permease subunit